MHEISRLHQQPLGPKPPKGISSDYAVRPTLVAALMLFLCTIGCMRRDGRNSDCRWPSEMTTHSATRQHLSEDAEFAEELAIRYADVHHGLRTPYYVSNETYDAARNRCMETLFDQIAKEHGVPVAQVSSALGHNRVFIDVAESMPFVLFYVFVVVVVVRLIWRRYPPYEEGWSPGITMALFLSLAFGVGGTMLGEVWFWFAEGYRIDNSHMSYRAGRFFWAQHRAELFAGLVIIFWLADIEAARHLRSNRETETYLL
jgi:hypothetical protein